MKTYICEICGDAHLGTNKPANCPFCGARAPFIKLGSIAKPVTLNTEKISDESKKFLEETIKLEKKAVAIYNCMANVAKEYEIKAIYKRLAKVELEHISIVCKILKIEKPDSITKPCSEKMKENFINTINLEEKATELYFKFAREVKERNIKILFTGLAQAEEDHIELIKNYL